MIPFRGYSRVAFRHQHCAKKRVDVQPCWMDESRKKHVTKQTRVLCGRLVLAVAALTIIARGASAQNIDKFTVTGEMAKKALVKGEINVATAEKLSQVCVDFAKQKKLEVANVILAPSGEIVYAYRMDGNAQSPFIMETPLRAKTACPTPTLAAYTTRPRKRRHAREIRYFATPIPM